MTARPGSLLGEADLAAARAQAEARCGRSLDDRALASSLMYPKVFDEFCAAQGRYGPVSALPTPVFFYGMREGQEIAVEIEPGKTLLVRLQAMAETDEEGQVRVFFELNGQPRIVKVPNRSAASALPQRRKGEEGNPNHVMAPMPGSISTVSVRPGQPVRAGDVLVTIEAMKMETVLGAPRDGIVAEVLAKPGGLVDAKDLVVVLE